uniref:Uncharacterized protein n=1 Tax=viral metagenome TaxID=1070528 RepID=A0A6C0BNB4_9ZZZZ
MNYVVNKISTGVGTALSVAGVGTGIVATTFAGLYGVPAAVVGVSVAAPVACAYDIFLGSGALVAAATQEQLDTLKAENDERNEQLQESAAQLQETEKSNAELRRQVVQLSEQLVTLDETSADLMRQNEVREAQLRQSEQQIQEQEAQIKKLWEIHGNLRLALQGLAVAGDTFDQFGGILAEHSATLSEKIDHLADTTDKLDETAAVLTHLTQSLDRHIETDRALIHTRELLFE